MEIYYGRADFEKKHAKLERFYKSRHFNIAKFVRLDLDAKNKVVTRDLVN
jgi:hypothetical protein